MESHESIESTKLDEILINVNKSSAKQDQIIELLEDLLNYFRDNF